MEGIKRITFYIALVVAVSFPIQFSAANERINSLVGVARSAKQI